MPYKFLTQKEKMNLGNKIKQNENYFKPNFYWAFSLNPSVYKCCRCVTALF